MDINQLFFYRMIHQNIIKYNHHKHKTRYKTKITTKNKIQNQITRRNCKYIIPYLYNKMLNIIPIQEKLQERDNSNFFENYLISLA